MIVGKFGMLDLGNTMSVKKRAGRLDMDYIIEKDRKDNRKKQRAWRDMRKNQIKAKRYHDRTAPEDGRTLNGEGIGFAKHEGWDFQKAGTEGWDGKSDEGYGLGDAA